MLPNYWFLGCLMLLMCATPIFARRVLLRPVFRAGGGPRAFAQFTVTDIASLTAYFAIASGLTALVADLLPESLANFTALVSLLYVLCTWYLGVQGLDAARVRDTRRRVVYLSLAVPAAYAGSMTIVVISMFAVYARWIESSRGVGDIGILFRQLGWFVWAVYAILWMSLILAWRVARWTVQPAVGGESVADSAPLATPSATESPPTGASGE